MRMEAQVLDQIPNMAVVKLKQRKFPGLLIQGDSLFILKNLAKEILENVKKDKGDKSEEYHAALELYDGLNNKLVYYEESLKKNSIELPY
jgi:hypothetical protein